MKAVKIEVPEDLLVLLRQSRLGSRPQPDRVRIALAIHLFQEGIISVGRAAELSGESRAGFELLLGEMGIPAVRYAEEDYEGEWQAIQRVRRQQP